MVDYLRRRLLIRACLAEPDLLEAVILPAVPDRLNLDEDGNPTLTYPTYRYGYDTRGNMTSITDPLGRDTWFTFDDQGRQLTRTLPLGVGFKKRGRSSLVVGLVG